MNTRAANSHSCSFGLKLQSNWPYFRPVIPAKLRHAFPLSPATHFRRAPSSFSAITHRLRFRYDPPRVSAIFRNASFRRAFSGFGLQVLHHGDVTGQVGQDSSNSTLRCAKIRCTCVMDWFPWHLYRTCVDFVVYVAVTACLGWLAYC